MEFDDDMSEEEMEEAVMNYLEEVGAMEWVGMSPDGDRILKPNLEKLKEYAPEIYEAMLEDLNKELLHLYELGLVELEYDENLEPTFQISDEGLEVMSKHGFELVEEDEDE